MYFAISLVNCNRPNVGQNRSYIISKNLKDHYKIISFKNFYSDYNLSLITKLTYFISKKIRLNFVEKFFDLILVLNLLLLTKKNDILHLYTPNFYSNILKYLNRKIYIEGYPHKNYIYNHKIFDDDESNSKYSLKRQIRTYYNADKIISPSNFVTKTLISSGIEKNKIIHIQYPITSKIKKIDSLILVPVNPNIFYYGNIKSSKGVVELIYAVQNLVNEGIDAKLYLIGNIHPSFDTKILSKDFIILKKNTLEILSYIDKYADIVIQPSYHEGCSKVVLESLALGKLVFASKNCGVDYLLNQKGRIFDVKNSLQISALIKSNIQKKVHLNNKKFIENYSLEKFIKKWENEVIICK